MALPKFRMETATSFLTSVQRGDFTVSVDLKDTY